MEQRVFHVLIVIVVVLAGCTSGRDKKPIKDEIVIFEDDFIQSAKIPDPTYWTLCKKGGSTWSRNLSESYDQSFVEDGKLVLVAEIINGEYQTGGIHSKGKFDFKYGKVEISAKLVRTAKGGFPALWMMPDKSVYGGNPKSGEIDIMEQLNNDTLVYQTIHNHYRTTLGNSDPQPYVKVGYNVNEFNVYGMIWDEEKIVFTVNGQETLTYPNLHLADEEEKIQWPFNHEFYMILNYSLGGDDSWVGNIVDEELPTRMEIDWVKVTQYK